MLLFYFCYLGLGFGLGFGFGFGSGKCGWVGLVGVPNSNNSIIFVTIQLNIFSAYSFKAFRLPLFNYFW
jgi:hypothetical protein